MKAAGFLSCVVEDPSSHAVIGVIDYKPGTEVYLSLLMLHPSCQRQGAISTRLHRSLPRSEHPQCGTWGQLC